jgi:hypothetical protein
MGERDCSSWKTPQHKWLSRRDLVRSAAGAVLGAGFLRPKFAYARGEPDDGEPAACAGANPIPGGVAPFSPYGIFIHHNPLNPANPLVNINDPSQITDFDGFVGLTHIRGGGTGTNTTTGVTMPLAFQADMGFSQGRFISTNGQQQQGTFAFV